MSVRVRLQIYCICIHEREVKEGDVKGEGKRIYKEFYEAGLKSSPHT